LTLFGAEQRDLMGYPLILDDAKEYGGIKILAHPSEFRRARAKKQT
jgi:hypothetical protein